MRYTTLKHDENEIYTIACDEKCNKVMFFARKLKVNKSKLRLFNMKSVKNIMMCYNVMTKSVVFSRNCVTKSGIML